MSVEIQRNYPQVVKTPIAPVSADYDIGAATAPLREQEMFGHALTAFGQDFHQKADAIISATQENDFKLAANAEYNQATIEIQNESDPTKYREILDRHIENIRNTSYPKVTHPVAKRNVDAFMFENTVTRNVNGQPIAGDWIKNVEVFAAQKTAQNAVRSSAAYHRAALTNNSEEDAIMAHDFDIAAGVPKEVADAVLESEIKTIRTTIAKNNAFIVGKSQLNPDGTINMAKAADEIDKQFPDMLEEDKLKIKKDLRDLSNQDKLDDDKAFESAVNEWDGQVLKFLKEGKHFEGLQWLNTLEASPSKQKELLSYIQETKKLFQGALSGKENYDDHTLIDELRNDSYDVATGEMTRKDFVDKVNDAFYNKHSITEATRDSLLAKLDKPLSDAATTEIRIRAAKAKEIILAYFPGISVDMSTGKVHIPETLALTDPEKVQLADRLKWAGMYEEELTNWIIKHDGDLGPEFRRFADDRKVHYQNASYEKDIREGIIENELPPITDKGVYDIKTRKLVESSLPDIDEDTRAKVQAALRNGYTMEEIKKALGIK